MVRRAALLALLMLPGLAAAQTNSNPGWVHGFVPNAAQWNHEFGVKVDGLSGQLVTPSITTGTLIGATSLTGSLASSGGSLSGSFGGNPTFSGAVSLSAAGIALAVTNNATVGGTLGVSGATTLSAAGTALAVTNNATFGTGVFGTTATVTLGTGSIAVASGQNLTLSMGGSTKTFTLAGTGGTGSVFVATAATAPSRQIDFSGTAVTGGTLVKTLRNLVAGPFAMSGAYSSSSSPLAISGALSGTLTLGTGNAWPLMQWAIAGDTAVATGGFAQFIDIQHTWGGAAMTGGRQTFSVHLNQGAQSGNGTTDAYFQAANFASDVTENEGGTGTTSTTAKGHNFALGGYNRMSGTATNWYANAMAEWDNSIATGSSSMKNFVFSFTHLSTHRVQGAQIDAALLFADQISASIPGWKDLILVGVAPDGQDPMDATNGSFIRWGISSNPGTKPPAAKNGFDFLIGALSGSLIRAKNFDVRGDGTGYWFNAKVAATAGGVSLDVLLKVGSYVSVASGGASNTLNDYYIDNSDVPAIWQATAVAGGIVSAAALVDGKKPYSSTSPGTLTLTNVNSDRPATFTVNTTWATQSELSLNPSGLGNVRVGTGSALATNATTGMLLIPSMAGTPTGTVGALGGVALNYDSTNKKLCVTIGATVECTAAMTP